MTREDWWHLIKVLLIAVFLSLLLHGLHLISPLSQRP